VTRSELPALERLSTELGIRLEEVPVPSIDFKQMILGESPAPQEGSDAAEAESSRIAADYLPEDLIKNLDDVYNLFNLEDPEKYNDK